ncbi:MAG: hypothetical protein NTX50_16585 [Candidatus Sumerlaeota bacterium]|nr:hypothetical protein [Candidatus Sumerlaeota bacterium]
MISFINEDALEQEALSIFESLGYQRAFGPDIAPDGYRPERSNYGEVVLVERLR